MRAVVVLLAASLAIAADEPDTKVKLPAGRGDIATGGKLFEAQCSMCHGTGGEGGRGPVLALPKLKRAADDASLVSVIKKGIDGTEMPNGWQMSDREILLVAAYVKSLGRIPRKPVPGNVAQGMQIYQKQGCASCHTIQGEGGIMGPSLDTIGLRRSAAYLRDAIIAPEAAVPDSFLQVRLVPKDTGMITGVRLLEDSFTIQVRDYSGKLHAYWKSDLKEILKDRGKSPMPSYKDKLNETELTDLVAYMASLREER